LNPKAKAELTTFKFSKTQQKPSFPRRRESIARDSEHMNQMEFPILPSHVYIAADAAQDGFPPARE
jgi:hypothetical protein